ncbi:MAG: hypothetical protein CMM62_00110 [Rhodospirillaceae bacterium]|nr:hypothetical protein [Rhodospirillaceae bacterium]
MFGSTIQSKQHERNPTMKRIRYDSPLPRWVWLFPLILCSTSFAAAAYLLPDPLDAQAWKATLRDSTRYIGALIQYASETRSMAAIKTAHRPTLVFFGSTVIAPFLSLTIVGLYFALRPTSERNVSKFANGAEVKRMELHGDLGPVLGVFEGKLLKGSEPRHTLAAAPTRSGKTRQAITTVLDYPGTVIVVDPKREIKQITAPHRSKIGPTHTIGFADPNSPSGWNPFATANIPTETVQIELAISRIASVLTPMNERATDKFWDETALRNMTALCMVEAYKALRTGEDGHLGNLISYIRELPETVDEDPFTLKMNQIAALAASYGAPNWVQEDLISFGQTEPKERGSHINSMLTKLQVFRTAATKRSLGINSFTVDDLRDRPCTVFIDFPREDARSFGPITAMFLDTIFTHALSNGRKENQYPILVIMDEFRDLPVIPNLISVMTAGAGAGLSAYILVQGYAQLKERYPDSYLNIINNCEWQIIFENPDAETQRVLTGTTGKTEYKSSSKQMNSMGAVTGKSQQLKEKDLMENVDWAIIPFGRHILIPRRHQIRPVYCTSAFWDKIPEIRRLVPRKNRIKT